MVISGVTKLFNYKNIKVNIIYEDNHLLVVEKPINVPVQEDISKDIDLLTILKQYIKIEYKKAGNVYLGLIHRLDRPVGGIIVFAKTSKAASRLSEQLRNKTMTKEYLAVVDGIIEKKEDTLKDRLLKDRKSNMTVVSPKGKEASLSYKLINIKNKLSLITVNLHTGRSHQIRVQFSTRELPLFGDQRYNLNSKVGEQIALFSSKLKFIHPVLKEEMIFSLPIPNRVPFNFFK